MVMVGEVGVVDACGQKGSGNVDGLQLKLTVTMSSLKPASLDASTQVRPDNRMSAQESQAYIPGDGLATSRTQRGAVGLERRKRRGLMRSSTRRE